MSWSDEFFNRLASGKDPPEERKSRIKKLIREELNKNPVLSNVLRENKAEGKFININSECPIDLALTWRNTKQGHKYWDKINDIVIDRLFE